jgi:hypothetical protein
MLEISSGRLLTCIVRSLSILVIAD